MHVDVSHHVLVMLQMQIESKGGNLTPRKMQSDPLDVGGANAHNKLSSRKNEIIKSLTALINPGT
jgi:hypothetical protein